MQKSDHQKPAQSAHLQRRAIAPFGLRGFKEQQHGGAEQAAVSAVGHAIRLHGFTGGANSHASPPFKAPQNSSGHIP